MSLNYLGVESKLCPKSGTKRTLYNVSWFEMQIWPDSFMVLVVLLGRLTIIGLVSSNLKVNKEGKGGMWSLAHISIIQKPIS